MLQILIADDDEPLRRVLRLMLQNLGHQVREARNGNEARRLLQEKMSDVLITDIIMPDKDGLESISELGRMHPNLKIIAMSGGGRLEANDYLKMAVKLGARTALPKPFSIEDLVSVLTQVTEAA